MSNSGSARATFRPRTAVPVPCTTHPAGPRHTASTSTPRSTAGAAAYRNAGNTPRSVTTGAVGCR
jgi:hypothetical protein